MNETKTLKSDVSPLASIDLLDIATAKKALAKIRDSTSDMWACCFAGDILKGKSIEESLANAAKYDEDV